MNPITIGQTDGGVTGSEADSEDDKHLAPVAKRFRYHIREFIEMTKRTKEGSKLSNESIQAAMVNELEMAMETDAAEEQTCSRG